MARSAKSAAKSAMPNAGTAAHDHIVEQAAELMRGDTQLSATAALRELKITERKAVRHYRPLLIAHVGQVASATPAAIPLRAAPETKKVSPTRSAPAAAVPRTRNAKNVAPTSAPAPAAPSAKAPKEGPKGRKAARTKSPAGLDPMALARPWLAFGLQATTAAVSVQAALVRLALQAPPVNQALRQSHQIATSMMGLALRSWWLPPKR